jgi:colanic acid biosynthesis glycosyl transferase WcaI
MMMRILIIHMRYLPDATGTGPLVTELARDLAAQGDEVSVITSVPHYGRRSAAPEYRGRLFHHSLEEGVQVCRTWAYVPRAGSVPGRGLDYLAYTLLSTWAAVRSSKPDVVLCVAPPITVGLSGRITGLVHRTPMVFNAQDIWPDGLVSIGRLSQGPLLAAFRWLERTVYRASARVVVVSEGMRRNLLAKGVPGSKVAVIPNWVDVDAVSPVAGPNRFRQELGLHDRFVVLFAGNLGYAASLSVIVEAAGHLRQDPQTVFLFVGEGSAKAETMAQAESLGLLNVRFVTTQPRERLAEVFGAADVSLVTLRKNMGTLSVPSKSYSIMASGRPMLAAVPEDSEIADLVQAADCGVWVPPEDPLALADAIRKLREDPAGREGCGRNGRAYVEAHFGRPAVTARYRELLHEVSAASRL